MTSFSSKRDLLSQWRAYADNGAGFAVGFRAAELGKLTLNGNNVCLHLLRVEYDPEKQELRAQRLVERILKTLEPLAGKTLDDQDDQVLATAIGLIFHSFAATAKNIGFEEEAELRLVQRVDQDPVLPDGAKPESTMPVCDFRPGRYGLTPFRKLQFPDEMLTNALSRIVMGPRVASPDTEQRIRTLLANAGVRNWSQFQIDSAKATYR